MNADDPLRKHVSDAAIAAQLSPPTDAEWLAKADRVALAKEALEHAVASEILRSRQTAGGQITRSL